MYTVVFPDGRRKGKYPSKDAWTAVSKAFKQFGGDHKSLIITMGEVVNNRVVRRYPYRVTVVPLKPARVVTRGERTFAIDHVLRVRAVRYS